MSLESTRAAVACTRNISRLAVRSESSGPSRDRDQDLFSHWQLQLASEAPGPGQAAASLTVNSDSEPQTLTRNSKPIGTPSSWHYDDRRSAVQWQHSGRPSST
eukprot:686699-Rhodomonas_salina.2